MTVDPSSFSFNWQLVGGLKMRARVFSNHQTVPTVPIVLLHGLGVSSRYMLPTADRLATRYDVFVPELPGFGASDKPQHSLGIPALADLLSMWLEAVGIPQAVFLGNSLRLPSDRRSDRAISVSSTFGNSGRANRRQRGAHHAPPALAWLL